jgi:DNA-binding response OmpR family regulator
MLCSNNTGLVDAASRAFSKDGYRLTVCECGLEALGVVEVMDADLLILDLDTPGLDGLLIVAAIKELAPTLPIVAVSTKPQVDARVVSHKGVSYAMLPPGSTEAMQVLLAGLSETERTRFPSGAGSVQ